jgi:benzoate-CoA ligase
MSALSVADHSVSPPRIDIPRDYNAAHDLLERNLQAGRGRKIAYIEDNESCTYAQLAERVNRFAHALHGLGLQMEQRVLLCLFDTIDFPVAFLGAIKAGIVPVAANTLLTSADFEYMLNDSRARALVVSAGLLPTFKSLIGKLPFLKHVIVSGGNAGEHASMQTLIGRGQPQFDAAPTVADEMCFWLYSSGSTGSPKGTVHVHSSLIQTAELFARPVVGLDQGDVVFSASKLPFAYGLGNSLSFPLAVGATAVLMAERPTPAAIFARLRKHQPTVFCTIPTAYAALLSSPELPRRDELRLRRCTSAGEPLPEDIGRRWSAHFGVDILDGIGSTEMLHIFLSNRPGEVKYGTTGKPVPGYEVRVVDEEGQLAPQGEMGELQVRGPTSAILYWNNRARSRSTFEGPWTHTGDKYTQREDGYYVYEGRIDDMLKVSGLFVSPAEVEAALISHDAVLEAAVVAKEDEENLIKPFAYVVLKSGNTGSAKLAEDLKQYVKSRLAPYKYPRWIEFMDELPKTATGKIQRFKLREMQRQPSAVKRTHAGS